MNAFTAEFSQRLEAARRQPWKTRCWQTSRRLVALGVTYHLLVNFSVRHQIWAASSPWRVSGDPSRDVPGPGADLPDLARYLLEPGYLFDIAYLVTLACAVAAIWFESLMIRIVLTIGYLTICSGNSFVLDAGVDAGLHYLVASLFIIGGVGIEDKPRWRILLHNAATIYMTAQAAVIYLAAGLWKSGAQNWRDGSALDGILTNPEFSYSGWAAAIAGTTLGVLLTYLVVAVELAAPVAAVSSRPWARRLIVGILLGMHVGIVLVMGLVSFGIVMMGVAIMLLRDSDLRWAENYFMGFSHRIRAASPARQM